MRMIVLALIGIVATVGVAGAAAGDGAPKKAGKISQSLVRAWAACTSTNDTTGGGLPLPACHPAVPSDATCAFDPLKGSGSVSAGVTGAPDMKVGVKLGGLNAGCEGETLCLDADIQVTSANCVSGDPAGCTSIDFDFGPILSGIPALCCTVVGGKCQVKASINTSGPPLTGSIVSGDNLSIKIGNCGVRRKTGPGAPTDTFSCGLYVP